MNLKLTTIVFILSILAGTSYAMWGQEVLVGASVRVTSISLPSPSYTSGVSSGTLISTASATLSSGTFTTPPGSWSTSGLNATKFSFNGASLQTNSATPTCSVTTTISLNIIAFYPGATAKIQAVTVTCTPTGGTAMCDYGITNVAIPIPAPAHAAGFDHCVAYYDFTSAALSNPNTFANNCGAPYPAWNLATPFLGTGQYACSALTVGADPDDPSGHPQVLQVSVCDHTQCAQQLGPSASFEWPGVLWHGCNVWSAGCLPLELYYESNWKIVSAGWAQNGGAGGAAHIDLYFTGSANGGLPGYSETDPWETLGGGPGEINPNPGGTCTDSATGCNCPVAPCMSSGMVAEPSGRNQDNGNPGYIQNPVPINGQYATTGALMTSDGSTIEYMCQYLNGTKGGVFENGAPVCLHMGLDNANAYLQHTNGVNWEMDLFGQTNSNATVAPIQLRITSVTIFACASYQTTQCTGTLVTQ